MPKASCTSGAVETMQVKIMEPGWDRAACMLYSLLPIITTTILLLESAEDGAKFIPSQQ